MKKRIVLAIALILVIGPIIYAVYSYIDYMNYVGKIVHETNRWTVIMDSKGEIIALETTSYEVWNELRDLHQDQNQLWIGGLIEEYQNIWGFRFKPDTIIIAEITIEGAQATIRDISEDLDYWMNTWGKETYVLARVTEIHEAS